MLQCLLHPAQILMKQAQQKDLAPYVLVLSVSRTGDGRPTDSGGANHHYKMCKEITSKETSKQIFLYSMMTTQMTCESLKRDNYRFTSQRELHVYSPRARLPPYL
jgi:hypothetical protein